MKKQQIPLKNSLLLLLTATIWGIAFVAQSEGGEAVGPLTFNATRNIIGSLVLIPVILLLNKINPQSNSADFTESDRQPMASSGSNPFSRNKTLIAGGIICGIACVLLPTSNSLVSSTPPLEKQIFSLHATLSSSRSLDFL